MSKVKIALGERSYVVTVQSGAIDRIGDTVASLAKPTKIAVVSNPTVARYYAARVMCSLEAASLPASLITVPAGERYKTLNTVTKIYTGLLNMKMDRKGLLIALGGGVIGDMVGFAAATYMRGIDFIQVPTTLLSQVDASVGGKTGVDLPQGKNLVGAFHQPKAVIIDPDTLATLPTRELRSGLAEVIKHGIIYDQGFFSFLRSHARDLLARRGEPMHEAIRRSVEIKRDVVQQDERESGLRAILNYGHTVGHAIEVLTNYRKYSHGEATAIGMVTEAILAEVLTVAEPGVSNMVADALSSMRLPVAMDKSLETADIVRAIELDKKTLGGKIRMALPSRIGECGVVSDIGVDVVAMAIDHHKRR